MPDAASTSDLENAISSLLPALTEFTRFEGPDPAVTRSAWLPLLDDPLPRTGVDLDEATVAPPRDGPQALMAIVGTAGSGKTLLLAELTRALTGAGVDIISGDYEGRRRKDRRTLAILAPTNKAASVRQPPTCMMRKAIGEYFPVAAS